MPLQNRVTPLGDLVADPARGLVYGNRGCLHDENGVIRRRYAGKRWIACRLEFRGWQRGALLQPGRFTELFFLDEATAFAAGHRPCALCRREDYDRFSAIWAELHPAQIGADAIDTQLHTERVASGTRVQLRHAAQLDELPDGAFVLQEGVPCLVLAFEHDVDSPPARAKEAATRIPDARFVEIADASHLAVFTHGDQVAAALVEFFGSV